jgi:DNA invertase Pin-like site-specific DNA recombinase
MNTKRQIRCAIYTRKSTEEGLEQDFNSLDAQREACAAYIVSQKTEGWVALSVNYDDGGYSGGTLERPSLQRLIEDLERGAVDVVVVYKIDRLSRSLMDFARLVEVFDRKGVTFVSVTQSFNTTTSMGRLTLNVLLSFAQFEREVTGERIRDKFAASKRKGMWMGGNPPLGYDVSNRKLVVNDGEAETVRLIFRRYLDLGCVRLLCGDLKDRGVVSKPRSSSNGVARGGKPIERSALHLILNNRTYIGETTHKGNSYAGEHQAIVPRDLFDRVQRRLAELRPPVRVSSRATQDAPLAGLLFDETGMPMLPTYTVKGQNRRYRYYTSRPAMKGEASRAAISRIPAPPLEHLMSGVLRRLDLPADTPGQAIDRVDIRANDVVIHIKRAEAIAIWKSTGPEVRQRTDLKILTDRRALLESGEALVDDGADLILSLPVRARFRGGDATVVHPSGMTTPRHDPTLIKALARAHQWRNMLLNGEAKSIEALAKHFGLDRGHVGLTLNLAFLSPTIARVIVRGEQPSDLRLSRLLRETVPLSWREQEAVFLTATAAQK